MPTARRTITPPQGGVFIVLIHLVVMRSKCFYGSLLAFAFGVGIETILGYSLPEILWMLFLGLVVAVVWRRKSSAFSAPYLLLTSVCLVSFSLGLLRTEIASWQFGQSELGGVVGTKVMLTGVVASEPDERERTVQFFLKTETDKVLISTDRLTPVSYGDVVEVVGRLERPETFTTELGRTFDYAGYLKARGVEYRMSFAEVTTAGSGEGNFLIAALLTIKQHFIATLEKILPEPAVGLAQGLLLGVKSALGEDIEEDFRRAVIIHIVVLSGYNVMLVVAFILFCFSYFMSLRARLIFGVVAIVAFALLVGLSATVVRASLMASLVLLAQFLGRRYHVLRALCFAGALMLLINPYLLIYDIGFQLSFMATLGLVLLLPHFEATFIEKGKSIGWREFFFATLATQVAVLPLLMYHIGEVSLIALLVNVLVLPIVPVAMLLTFFTGILGSISLMLGGVVGLLTTFSLNYILLIADWSAALPFAAVTVPAFSAWGVFALYGILFAFWYWWQRRKGALHGEMPGWTIENEDDRPQKQVPPKEELPVFFR